ncbi:SPW repeat domain-containing protein [Methylorubrum extorquens]|uniref:SPW repeat domain-containing protein n=1 Tax=Methylorubrum extorquens TaxID=408 RepID=UPI002238EE47|nr:SPW repeat protein [Methylorubrum extorquens]UYW33508.1 SPW repeat protein [Methylorubrum extorquens]
MSNVKEAVAGDRMGRALNGFVAAIGALIAASPFFLSFSDNVPVTANALLCGIAVSILAVMNKRGRHAWAEWSALALGPWIIASPWLLRADIVPSLATGAIRGFEPEVAAHIAFGMALLIASAFVIVRSGSWPLASDA